MPDLPTPEGADLLQVLWCPFDHPAMPRTALFWRSAAAVTDILATPPEPPVMRSAGYLPEPCLLNPERVTEYPDHLELSKELRQQLGTWSAWRAAVTDVDDYASSPELYYDRELAGAPGWKVGGWPRWGATDPTPRLCTACGSDMDALLTIATFEGEDGSSWLPDEVREDRERAGSSAGHTGAEGQVVIDFFRARGIEVHDRGRVRRDARVAPLSTKTAPRQPTAVEIASGYDQQLYVCPVSPEHPHSELMH
ncbi:non-ribosomal peptide synthetase [Streptomyces sp. NPDC002690]